MPATELFQRFRCRPLDPAALPPYVGFALQYFRTPEKIAAPELSCCLQLDLSAADEVYRRYFAATPGASLTAYLTWRMLQAQVLVQPFLWRWIAGAWHHMADPPLFFPVATGTANTFRHVALEQVVAAEWTDFSQRYRAGVDAALAEPLQAAAIDPDLYRNACFIGNLPYLAFTSLGLHRHPDPSGRTVAYFGKRQEADGRLTCPLALQFDHATTDPYQVNRLIETYLGLLVDSSLAGRPSP